MATTDLREKILTNELGNQMLDSVVQQYDNSAFTLHVFQALGIVLSKEKDFIQIDLINQIFPQTATWGLKYWEEEYGIITEESKTIEQRRNYLLSILQHTSSMTPARVRQIVKSITGLECEVKEGVADNTILITIRGYFPNSYLVTNELDRKLPAHLNYELLMAEFTGIEVTTVSGFSVSTYKRYELEVLN